MVTPNTGFTITSVVITANSSSYAESVGGTSVTNCTKTVSGSTVTLTPTDGTATLGFQNSAQSRLNYVVVNYEYESSGTSPLDHIVLNTSNVQTEFYVGDTFDYSGLIVTAYYENGTEDIVTPSSVSSPNMSTAGDKTITVTYTENNVSKTANYTITVNSAEITAIYASVSKTYHPGDTISSSDVYVEDNLGNEVTNFSFANDGYQFTYSDASSGGALTNKTFTNSITGAGKTCSLTVQVQRKAHIIPSSVKDTITATGLGVSGNSYSSYTNKTFVSDAVYSAYCMKDSSNNIQMRTTNSNSGIVSTTSGGTIQSVKIVVGSGDKTIQVYAKNTAYSSPSDLFSSTASTKGTLIDSTTTTKTITFTDSYTYFGIRSSSGAIYLGSIEVTYGDSDSATNLSNYIMYTDTTNQCETKFDVAKGYFEDLSSADRSTFMTSDDYVISTARTRLQAWANHLGKSINYTNGDYVITNARIINPIINNKDNGTVLIVVISSLLSVTAIGGYFFFRKQKQ